MMNVELGPAGMAQDKSAEIIKFNGPGEAPEADLAPEAVIEPLADTGPEIDAPAQSLEEAGAGVFLAQARHKAKLTLEQASDATKVKAEHLEAIEWMRLDRLPSLPYATGFVKAYARYLKLDAEAIAAQFKAQATVQTASAAPSPALKDSVSASDEGANLGSVFAMLAVALFALWIGYQVLTGGNRDADVKQAASTQAPAPIPAPYRQILTDTPAQTPDLGPDPTADSIQGYVAPPPAEQNDALASDPLETLTTTETTPEVVEAASAGDAALIATPPRTEATTNTAPTPAVTAPVQTERRERPLPRRAVPAARPTVSSPVIVEANLTRSTSPDYPNSCTRGAGALESVTIIFDVSAGGRAVNSRVASSTNGCFDSEALRTVGRWRFDPRTVDGNAVAEAGKRATLNFKK